MKTIFFIISISISLNLFSLQLTLDECIKLTFEKNPTLRSKLADLNAAEYSYYASINTYYPKLSLSSGFSRSGGEKRPPSNSFSASLSFSQTIFNYNSIYSIKSARINYEIAQLTYESYLVELRKNLYTAFYTLLFAQDLVAINEKIVEIRKENAQLINLKYQSGFESKGDMLYAKAQYEMAKINLEKAKRQLEIASNSLKNIIGIESDELITVIAEKDVEKLDFNPSSVDLIIKNLPQYKIYLKNIELAEKKIKNAELDWLPSLSFSTSRSYSGKTFFPDNSSWSMSVSMSIPLFSSGITYRKNNIKTLKESLISMREKLKDYLISQKNNIINSYSDYLLSLSLLETYKTFLQASEERFSEAQIKYLAGKMSYIDLENIEQNLIDARQNINEYKKTLFLKKINFEYLCGIPLRR